MIRPLAIGDIGPPRLPDLTTLRAAAVELRQRGMRKREIAAALGLHWTVVCRLLRDRP